MTGEDTDEMAPWHVVDCPDRPELEPGRTYRACPVQIIASVVPHRTPFLLPNRLECHRVETGGQSYQPALNLPGQHGVHLVPEPHLTLWTFD